MSLVHKIIGYLVKFVFSIVLLYTPACIDPTPNPPYQIPGTTPADAGNNASTPDANQTPTANTGIPDELNMYTNVVLLSTGCSGVLVSSNYVLTAAHCICGTIPGKSITAATCNTSVTVAVSTLDNMGSWSQQPVSAITVHPSFSMTLDAGGKVTQSNADLALLRLTNNLPASYGVATISTEDVQVGETLSTVGFPQQSCVKSANQTPLRTVTYTVDISVSTDKLGIGPTAGAASTVLFPGSSGGPLFRLESQPNGYRNATIVGIASTSDCTTYSGSTFTNAVTYRQWVQSKITTSPSTTPVCGDKVCDPSEKSTCCTDCGCANGTVCNTGQQSCDPLPKKTCDGNAEGWYCVTNPNLVMGPNVEVYDTDRVHCQNNSVAAIVGCTLGCEIKPGMGVDECAKPNPCATNNGGCGLHADCSSPNGSPVCTCVTGYVGNGYTCTLPNPCDTNNGGCDAHATCAQTSPGIRTCTCSNGYTGGGTTCAPINLCATNNGGCDPNAQCTPTGPGTRTCACNNGYTGTGTSCTVIAPTNPCANNGGCDQHASCTPVSGFAVCTCISGYSGSGYACTAVNACATSNGGCDVNALCTPTGPGTRTCACNNGYTGNGLACTVVAPTNPCAVNNGGCDQHASCAPGSGGAAVCTCMSGYSGSGTTCTSINPCLTNNGLCDANATCTQNGPGSRSCVCKNGFTGDGLTCTATPPSDPCAANNGGCSVNATCTNANGTAVCACKTNYSGDGRTCTADNPCTSGNGGCDANATCTQTGPGTRSCTCKTGFTGNGTTCTATPPSDPCTVNNGGCSTNANCTNVNGSPSCVCKTGFDGNGYTCTATPTDPCTTNNGGCNVNATCFNNSGAAICTCKTGYTGNGYTCTANSPTCTTTISGNACSLFTAANANGPYDIFQVCGEVIGTDRIRIRVRKANGGTLGVRPYGSRVSSLADPECSHSTTNYYDVSQSVGVLVSGYNTTELTLEFNVTWATGQTDKKYCAVASTILGDLGYNSSDPAQLMWWYSPGSVKVHRTCN